MSGINKVILVGRLGKDPEVKAISNDLMVANFSIATSEQWKDKQTGERKERTEWHRVVLYSRLAELAGQYLTKGQQVYIEGKLQTREWEDKDGNKRYTTEIVGTTMQFLDNKREAADGYEQASGPAARAAAVSASKTTPAAPQAPYQPKPKPTGYAPPPEPSMNDDDIPF